MNKFLFTFFCFLALKGRCQDQRTGKMTPNVILLYADNLGYGDISCDGATQITTAHIDDLAMAGLRFTNGHCAAATCTPSRYAILTGEYAWRKPGTNNLPGDAPLILPTDRATLASVFQRAVYHTAAIGKWHLGLGYRGDAILQMHYAAGQITQTLADLGLSDRTIVIFTSDDGPVLNDGYLDRSVRKAHGHRPAGVMRSGKYSILEGGTRIQMIIRWPGHSKAGTTSPALVGQVDFLASFAAMVNQPLAPRDGPDSYNEFNALMGITKQGRGTYIEQGRSLALVDSGWKYIVPHPGPAMLKDVQIESGLSLAPRLDHLEKDLGEKINLASRYPEKVQRMATMLDRIRHKGYSRPKGAPAR